MLLTIMVQNFVIINLSYQAKYLLLAVNIVQLHVIMHQQIALPSYNLSHC